MACRRPWEKTRSSVLVRACCGVASRASGGEESSRRLKLRLRYLIGGCAISYGKLRQLGSKKLQRAGQEVAAEEAQKASVPSLWRAHRRRPGRSAGVLEHACGAMNWSGLGHAEYAASSDFRRTRCASGVIVWRIPRSKWTGARCFIRVPRPNQAALLIACGAGIVDSAKGGWNRRCFTNERKRAIVQET